MAFLVLSSESICSTAEMNLHLFLFTVFQTSPLTSAEEEERLRVSSGKPAREQDGFTEYVATVTDSELSCLVGPKHSV